MRDTTYESFGRFLEQPISAKQPTRKEATEENPRFEFRLMRKEANGYPNKEDLEAVVWLSHDSPRIRRANTISSEQREALYTQWFLGNRYAFGLLERIPADKHGISIIGNTAILPLKQKTVQRIGDGEVSTVRLDDSDFCGKDNYEVLLLDTWVLHIEHQTRSSWFSRHKETHRGYGNGLVLRHLAEFWNPSLRKDIKIYAEPDTVSMANMLPRLGFQRTGDQEKHASLWVLSYPPPPRTNSNVLRQRLLEETVASLAHWRKWCPRTKS